MDEILFLDDPSHPIPYVDSLDVQAIWEDGRSVLSLIIAAPLEIDQRSRERLMRKLENYLGFINSEPYKLKYGSPSTATTLIQICLHPDMDRKVEETLLLCEPWIEQANASLKIQYLNNDLSIPDAH